MSNLKTILLPIKVGITSALLYSTIAILLGAIATPIALANDREKAASISIPSGSLAPALRQYAEQAGIFISFNSNNIANAKTSGIEGQYNAEQGLEVLLRDSGYFSEKTANGYIIKPVENASQSSPEQLSPIRVIGSTAERYQASSASSATPGVEVDLLDTPRSIIVVPEQVFDDQGAKDLRDILRNVSGVQTLNISGGGTDGFTIRGIDVRDINRDGFQLDPNTSRIQVSNIERLEVVKGPTAILSGQSSGGGVINVISKKPKAQPRHIASVNIDEFGQRELVADSTGKLNSDGSLLYRIVGSIENSETFRESTNEAVVKRSLIAPSFTWNISDRDSLTALAEISSTEIPNDGGTLLVRGSDNSLSIPNIDQTRRFEDDDNLRDSTQRFFRLAYESLLNDNWQFQADFSFQSTDNSLVSTDRVGGLPALMPGIPVTTNVLLGIASFDTDAIPAGGLLISSPSIIENETDRSQFAFRINGEGELGQTQHYLTLGTDFNRRELSALGSMPVLTAAEVGFGVLPGLPALPGVFLADLIAFDITDPVFDQTVNEFLPMFASELTDTQIGLFASDSISFNEKWKALVGLRVDRFERNSSSTRFFTNIDPIPGLPGLEAAALTQTTEVTNGDRDSQTELSPNIGVVYQPTEKIGLFAGYSESFEPQFFTTPNGEVIDVDPLESEQIEVGVKGSFLNDKLAFNLAYFDITRSNIVGSVSGFGIATINDEETRRGIELDTSVQFANGLSLIFNFAHIIEAEISAQNNNDGNEPRNVPDNTANLWATYEFTNGPLKGFGFGGGATHVGERFVNGANTFELDSYTTYDATAFYYVPIGKTTQLRLQAGVRNITDEEFFLPVNPLRIGVGTPRTFFASVGIEF